MKDKLLLIGAGGFGRVVLEHVYQLYDCAFLDDDDDLKMVDNTIVLGRLDRIEELFPEYKYLLVTIGNNILRQKIYEHAALIGYDFPNVIVSSAYISPHAFLGRGIIALNNVVVQNNAHVGDGTILSPGVEAHHDSYIGDYCLVYTNSVVRSLATVGNRALIGSTASVSTNGIVPTDAIIEDGMVVK